MDKTENRNPSPLRQPLVPAEGSVYSVSFSPEGKRLASESWDKTIRVWDIPFYFMFWKDGRSTELLNVFAEGVEFFWQVTRKELEF